MAAKMAAVTPWRWHSGQLFVESVLFREDDCPMFTTFKRNEFVNEDNATSPDNSTYDSGFEETNSTE
ncbi:hypothetical protein NECAME_07772 [Necator americanus]|uniref:Uncharacterized protein n=1 Tax=Necator americanus TaxID=51031 RepID=W2TP69_NECAM|nr:hypothetical protein NECAME_07772 [Necator americanus]ETN82767.1 hypothetical protein NECAME_07772 [Necator americanus]